MLLTHGVRSCLEYAKSSWPVWDAADIGAPGVTEQ